MPRRHHGSCNVTWVMQPRSTPRSPNPVPVHNVVLRCITGYYALHARRGLRISRIQPEPPPANLVTDILQLDRVDLLTYPPGRPGRARAAGGAAGAAHMTTSASRSQSPSPKPSDLLRRDMNQSRSELPGPLPVRCWVTAPNATTWLSSASASSAEAPLRCGGRWRGPTGCCSCSSRSPPARRPKPYGIRNQEWAGHVYVCTGPSQPCARLWRRLRHYD